MLIKIHHVYPKHDPANVRRITGASDVKQAWEKFQAQYFRGSPLLPSRRHYCVRQIGEYTA